MKAFDECFISYNIRSILINEGPLSIGAGRGALIGGIDNPIIRLNGKPIIPGSSIKGVLRSEAERYARSRGWPVCDVISDSEYERSKKRELGENYEPCVVCRVFGGPTIASHLVFFNAVPKSFRTDVRTCVTICRLTGGQYPGRLFDIEYVSPGSEFEWTLRIEGYDIIHETDKQEVELINYLIRKFAKYGMWIGGRKSTGHGLVKMKIEKVEREALIDGDLKIEDCTKEYLKIIGLI